MNQNKILNIKYALINVFYFMLACGAFGYVNNYLTYKGFPSTVIGIVLTVISICTLAMQMTMAPIIDHSTKWTEKKFILATLFVAIAMYLIMLFLPDDSPILLVVCVIGFSVTSVGMPFLNSLAFAYEQEGLKINYGIGRGIGSASYAVGGIVVGWLVALAGGQDEAIVQILPYYMIALALLSVFAVSLMKNPVKVMKDDAQETKSITYLQFFKKYKKILIVVVAFIMVFFCHFLINTYMINVIQDIGGNTSDQGNAIFIQAICELPPMFLFAVILKKVKVNKLMILACFAYTVKHILIYFAPNMTVYYLAMVLQMFSYAILIPASVYFAEEHVDPEDRNMGQTIMTSASTVGGLLASFFGGMMLSFMSVHSVLLVGSVITAIGAVIMVFGIRILEKK